jgi:CII-binding regulator of phage lambda lysogenization HflD
MAFLAWIMIAITLVMKEREQIDKETLHVSMPPTLEAKPYQTMYAFGNHIHVSATE